MRILAITHATTAALSLRPNASDPALLPGNHLLRRPVNSGSVSLLAAWKGITGSFGGYFSGSAPTVTFCSWGCRRERQDMRDSICP